MLVAGGVLAAALGLGGWVIASRADGPHPAGPAAQVAVPRGPAGQPAGSLRHAARVRVARPARLVIPVIGVSTRLIRLGLTSAHTLQVPVSTAVAGWYKGSPRPGAIGASVIAGHIDSRDGPGVFYRLRLLRRGERVYVLRADHSVAMFKITAVRTYPKDRFPQRLVYGALPDAELRLITCGGLFDYGTGSYLSNVIVYAVLIR